ncbi:MAG: sensor histidine kinase [Chloroflexi bacterium]|nr:sensor histidine kinase [Chloroflexota bacterium]
MSVSHFMSNNHRILSVTEEELSRIVLDIHDGPVQYLFASLSLLTQIQSQLEACEEPTAADELLPAVKKTSHMVEEALHEIRSFLGAFRPPEFHTRPLAAIIEGLALQHEDWTGQVVNLEVGDMPEDVTTHSKIALYRILQEALSNAYRHAGVDQIDVKVWGRDSMIWLQVDDDGQGFTPPPLHGPQATEREEHIGLRGMRDRVNLLGGRFHLYSRPGKGTHIMVKIPAQV